PTGLACSAWRRWLNAGPARLRRRSLLACVERALPDRREPCRGYVVVLLERQHLAHARLFERALHCTRAADQPEAVAALLAEPAAKRDHSHTDRIDSRQVTHVERDVRHAFFAEP